LAKDATATILQLRHSVTRFAKADVKKAKAAEADAAVVANVSEAQLLTFAKSVLRTRRHVAIGPLLPFLTNAANGRSGALFKIM